MIAEIADLLRPRALRFDVAHWPSANTYCVTVRDGGETLCECQAGTLEAALDGVLTQARAKGERRRRAADLLG